MSRKMDVMKKVLEEEELSASVDDEDLKDLLSNVDDDNVGEKDDNSNIEGVGRKNMGYYNWMTSGVGTKEMCEFFCGSLREWCCVRHYIVGRCLIVISFYLVVAALVSQLFYKEPGGSQEEKVMTDVHETRSMDELKWALEKVDHWCLDGSDDNCGCENPLIPHARNRRKPWKSAVLANRRDIDSFCEQENQNVVFVGESVVEMMNGRFVGQPLYEGDKNQYAASTRASFKKAFPHGLALGVGGDTSPYVLFRLQPKLELPDCLNPKLFWVVLGMNELARRECSEDLTVISVLAVVEHLQKHRPHIPIVINSLLPMTDLRIEQQSPDPQLPLKDLPLLNAFDDARTENDKDNDNDNDPDDQHFRRLQNNTNHNQIEELILDKQRNKWMQRRYREAAHRDRRNPYLKDDQRTKINPMLHPFLHTKIRKHPLWPAVHRINLRLRSFAEAHPQVHYYDASPLFITPDHHLNSKTISLRGHPTIIGYRRWLLSIQQYIFANIVTKTEKHTGVHSPHSTNQETITSVKHLINQQNNHLPKDKHNPKSTIKHNPDISKTKDVPNSETNSHDSSLNQNSDQDTINDKSIKPSKELATPKVDDSSNTGQNSHDEPMEGKKKKNPTVKSRASMKKMKSKKTKKPNNT